MPNATRQNRTLRALPLLLILACAPGVTDNNKIAASFAASSSPATNVPVGSVAAPAPAVLVTNSGGHPVQGVSVTFAVTAGHGTVSGASVQTDKNGVATVGGWTYGLTAGANQLTATVDGVTGKSVVFNVSTIPSVAASVSKINDGQSAIVGEPLAQPVGVEVRDNFGNLIAGVTVNFAAASGSVSQASAQTDASGRAQTQWTMGGTVGVAAMTATVGSLAPVSFSATATVAPPAKLARASDSTQAGTVATTLTNPISVKVTDKYGNVLSGVQVQFATSGNGASANPSTTLTDAQGIASTQWTLDTVAGIASLTASSGTLASVSFKATAKHGAPENLDVAAYPARDTVGTSVGDALTLTLTDHYHNPISGATSSFTPSAGGSATPASDTTNASGVVKSRWMLPTLAGPASLVANVGGLGARFDVTAIPGMPVHMDITGDRQNGTVGALLPSPVTVKLSDTYGNAVSGVGVKFTASGDAVVVPSSDTTSASGQISASWTLPTKLSVDPTLGAVAAIGGTSYLFHATSKADVPATIASGAANGENQSGTVGTTLTNPLVVVVRDKYGNPVDAAMVVFTPSAGSVNPDSARATTQGQASTMWTLGSTAGTQKVTVTSGSAPAYVFNATANAVVSNDPCAIKGTIPVGGSVAGNLAGSTCLWKTTSNGKNTIDNWSLNLSNAGPLRIDYTADNGGYDTYMNLYRSKFSGTTDIIATNDDAPWNGTNSGLRILGGTAQLVVGAAQFGVDSKAPGAYHIAVSSWNAQLTGEVLDVKLECAAVYAVGGTITTTQALASGDCSPGVAGTGTYADQVLVYLRAGESVQATMTSGAFDAKLVLQRIGSTVAEDDNGAGGTDASLSYTASVSDIYALYASNPSGLATGSYTLNITVNTSAPLMSSKLSTTSSLTSSSTSTTTSQSFNDALMGINPNKK